MPTILRVGPYRFFFYASDQAEPTHVHVEGSDGSATLAPVRLHTSRGVARHEHLTFSGWWLRIEIIS